jgi:hypothetical protein
MMTLPMRAAQAADVRATNPNAVSLELLGRGMLWGLTYDRAFADRIVAGAGFGYSPMRTAGDVDMGSAKLIPVYVNVYLSTEGNSFFATGGASIVANSGDTKGLKATYSGLDFGTMPLIPQFGVGFESRQDAGFLFRATVYGVIANEIRPWFGITLGYSI